MDDQSSISIWHIKVCKLSLWAQPGGDLVCLKRVSVVGGSRHFPLRSNQAHLRCLSGSVRVKELSMFPVGSGTSMKASNKQETSCREI